MIEGMEIPVQYAEWSTTLDGIRESSDPQRLAGAGLLCGLNSSSRDIVILGVPNESAKNSLD